MEKKATSTLFILLAVLLTASMPSYAADMNTAYADGDSKFYLVNDEETIARYYRNGQHSRVVNEMNRLRRSNTTITPNMIYFEGRSLERVGESNRAINVFNEYIEKAPSSHRYMRDAVVVLNRLLISQIESEASRAEEDRIYNRAISENTPGAFRNYLNQFPNGRYRAEILNLLDNAVYGQARSEGTRSAYNGYLREFPNGRHAREAQSRINNIDARSRIQSLERDISSTEYRVRRNRNQRNQNIVLGVLGVAATGGAIYAYDYYKEREDEDFYSDLAIVAAGPIAIYTIFKFGDVRRNHRVYKREKGYLEELERDLNTVQRGITSIELAPKINPYNSSFALSVNIRF
ncbi:MAG: hypothetical protein LAT80_11775 [Balneolaceae bacterium]|nr:hypothetical protein [Balneolaceae bacterium]